MSKLIKSILIPENIIIKKINDYYQFSSENGLLNIKNNAFFNINIDNRILNIQILDKDKKKKKYIGTYFSILVSKINGLSKKFKKILLIVGVGYKAYIQDQNLILNLGYSNNIVYNIPKNINLICKQNEIHIEGINKQLVGQTAADIRNFKKPDVYKGKGIRYINEKINFKEIKKK